MYVLNIYFIFIQKIIFIIHKDHLFFENQEFKKDIELFTVNIRKLTYLSSFYTNIK